MSQDPHLTLYRVSTDDMSVLGSLFGYDEPVLVLGYDAANGLVDELAARPDVLTVTAEPLPWGAADELAVIEASYFNGADLFTPVMALAAAEGLDFDPENFDPVAVLTHLRGEAIPC